MTSEAAADLRALKPLRRAEYDYAAVILYLHVVPSYTPCSTAVDYGKLNMERKACLQAAREAFNQWQTSEDDARAEPARRLRELAKTAHDIYMRWPTEFSVKFIDIERAEVMPHPTSPLPLERRRELLDKAEVLEGWIYQCMARLHRTFREVFERRPMLDREWPYDHGDLERRAVSDMQECTEAYRIIARLPVVTCIDSTLRRCRYRLTS